MSHCPHPPAAQGNPLKSTANDLYAKSASVTQELNNLRTSYQGFRGDCLACVAQEELETYLAQHQKVKDALDELEGEMELMKAKIDEEVEERGEREEEEEEVGHGEGGGGGSEGEAMDQD